MGDRQKLIEQVRRQRLIEQVKAGRQGGPARGADPRAGLAAYSEKADGSNSALQRLGELAAKGIRYPFNLARVAATNFSLTGPSLLYHGATGKNVVRPIDDTLRALQGNAPEPEEYLERAGFSPGTRASEAFPDYFSPEGSSIKEQLLSGRPAKGGMLDVTPRGAVGTAMGMGADYLSGKLAGKVIQDFGKGVYKSAPGIKKADAVLRPDQKPVSEILWETGKNPASGRETIDILTKQKKIYESVRNQINSEMAEAGVRGNIAQATQRAQNYVNRMKGNRELEPIVKILQADIDDLVQKYTPSSGTPTVLSRKRVFSEPDPKITEEVARRLGVSQPLTETGAGLPVTTKTRVTGYKKDIVPNNIESYDLTTGKSTTKLGYKEVGRPIEETADINAYIGQTSKPRLPEANIRKTTLEKRIEGVAPKLAPSGEELGSVKTGVSAQMSPEEFNRLSSSGAYTGYKKAKGAGLKEELENMASKVNRVDDIREANEGLSSLYSVSKRMEQLAALEAGNPAFSQVKALSLIDPRLAALKQLGETGRITGAWTGPGRFIYNSGRVIEKANPYFSPWFGVIGSEEKK